MTQVALLRLVALLWVMFSAAAASAQPNRLSVLERVRAQHPDVWHAAHRDYGFQGQPGRTTKWQAELFVRVVADRLNQEDAGTEHEGRWGVNGKRGAGCNGKPLDLSQDVIVYQLRKGWNVGLDVIPGAGGSRPSLHWPSGVKPSSDTTGCWVQGTPISNDEIRHVMAGGKPFPAQPFQWSGVAFVDAANQVIAAFTAKHGRQATADEIALIVSWAQQLGWNGGDQIPKKALAEIVKRVQRYSGDVSNPFPTVTVDEARRRLDARWQARFGRDVQPIELDVIIEYAATQWDGIGDVPVWLLNDILAHSDSYDGSLVAAGGAEGIDPSSEFTSVGIDLFLDGQPFEWRGQTAFLLNLDWFHRPAQYRAARDAMKAARVNVARVSVATSSEYLQLQPRSGGTFGLGFTTPLYPGSVPDFWPRYRAMLADLAAHGIVAEVVPFLTAGLRDKSVPQTRTEAARMAFVEEVARELLPFRPFFGEIANEYNFIGFNPDGREIVRLWERWKQIDPRRLVARSAPSGPGDTQNAHLMAGGDYITVHADRRTKPHSWSWIVHQLGLPQLTYGKRVINDEGINADTVGEYGNDATPANHWANGVMMRLVPGLSYTFHYDRALKGLPPSMHDGSLPAINAWRDGMRAVPDGVHGQYVAYPGVLGADAAVARLGESEGWLLLIGATTAAVDVPEWHEALVGAHGPHRLYRLTR